MICSKCNQKEANVLYTEIINGKKKEQHLCEECASKFTSFQMENPDWSNEFNLGELLSSLLTNYYKEDLPKKNISSKVFSCKKCKISYEEVMRTGRFGCAECYTSFYNEIGRMLKGLQGSDIHSGKRPEGYKSIADNLLEELSDIERLEIKLKDAVQDERFEEAAGYRDEILKLKKGATNNNA
ncbi:MAG TPA: hypothetical protein GXZ90_05515 [Clostridiales bacterium]|nr:hypothetical protein [Clostridiales bacterium]